MQEAVIETPIEIAPGSHVLFTTRESGNLSPRAGDPEAAGRAREQLRERLHLDALAYLHQVHGADVRDLTDVSDGCAGDVRADGQTSSEVGVGLVAFTADCLPVALAGEDTVAMLHAGWRGLAAGVLEEGVRALRSREGFAEIVAVIGPGAGRCCYEVGEEVHAAFGDAHRQGRHIDLKAAARERLLAAGVGDVRDVRLCTICDERFFSHRREGARAGRQAGVAWRA